MTTASKVTYVYTYVISRSNHIHEFLVKDKYHYTFFVSLTHIVERMMNIFIYNTPVTVIYVRVNTRYLELGMRKHQHLYSHLGYDTIFPIYGDKFGCTEIEIHCRGIEKVLRLRRKIYNENVKCSRNILLFGGLGRDMKSTSTVRGSKYKIDVLKLEKKMEE